VCGDFIHSGALNTTSGGRVRFIGSGVQNYTRAAGATGNFYQVIVDKPAATLANRRVEVTQGNMTITNQLHLVDGRIATLATNAVVITNANPASIIGHNVNNYIQGRLQRAIQNTGGLYALPVGDVHPAQLATGKGYQLAEITLSNPTNVTALLSFFTPTPQTIPATAEPVCGTNYNCAIDNGFWTIQPRRWKRYGHHLQPDPLSPWLRPHLHHQPLLQHHETGRRPLVPEWHLLCDFQPYHGRVPEWLQ
jgi:hypothetical protein